MLEWTVHFTQRRMGCILPSDALCVNILERQTLRIRDLFNSTPIPKFDAFFCSRGDGLYMIDTDLNHAIMSAVPPETAVFLLMKYGGSGKMTTGDLMTQSSAVRRKR